VERKTVTLAYESSDASKMTRSLLDRFSLEMTGKDVKSLTTAAADGAIPLETPVNVTYLATEDLETRLEAVRAVKRLGFQPVPHLSARRLRGESELRAYLEPLRDAAGTESVFVVGGDPKHPEGPYPDALSVIRSGVLEEYGVRAVGIGGYPEGHPDISDDLLWQALTDKAAALAERGLETTIITQFCFDVDPVLEWVTAVRQRGIQAPIRIGVPGPAGVKRLLGYAKRFGVGTGTEVVRKYGFSLTNLLGTAGPDKFLRALAEAYDPARHGRLALHFYAFGGLEETANWVTAFRGDDKESHS
jgi:methylenetetrahydrofolate reductase (NADPH)